MTAAKPEDLSDLIAEIDGIEQTACRGRWLAAFGRPPPKHLSQRFIKKVLIWDLQTNALGGVSAKTERRLKQIASGKSVAVVAKPGSHLVREWNGRTYQVEAAEDGYVMDA